MHPERINQNGFTLIELIVVMALISLMATLSIPRFHSYFLTDQLKKTTRIILGIVSQSSQEAVRSHTGLILVFDLMENMIQSDSQPDNEQKKLQTYLTLPDSVRIVDISSVHGGKQTQGRIKLHFSRKGYIDKTYIHLRDDDENEMTIMLSPFMGVVQIVDSYVELSGEEIFQ